MEKVDITIVGAGVVGLACAFELSATGRDIYVIEKELSFGQGISSRNSEVVHAGIYYPKDSLKARTCIEGRRLIYDFCSKYNVGHQKIGKLIVANDSHEIDDLKALFKNGLENGVKDLTLLGQEEIKKIEPNIVAQSAIYSPSTGILDSHGFMKALASGAKDAGAQIIYNTEVTGAVKDGGAFRVDVEDKREGPFSFSSKVVINAAGLCSDKVAESCGINNDNYRLKYCKGDYLRVNGRKSAMIKHLVYPVPKRRGAGLGIHATLDLAGSMRLGPDDEYVKEINYDINPVKRKDFYQSVVKFMPFIEEDDLTPDTSGIRPKLQGEGETFRDFVIKEETDAGLAGLINLIGIESPGLTGSLSIAKMVKGIVDKI